MYAVSPDLYREASQRLCDAIDGDNYFSGTVCFRFEDADCRLTCSVIVYRKPLGLPDRRAEAICDLIPVWLEFHTLVGGEERLNDFSFEDLKRHVVL